MTATTPESKEQTYLGFAITRNPQTKSYEARRNDELLAEYDGMVPQLATREELRAFVKRRHESLTKNERGEIESVGRYSIVPDSDPERRDKGGCVVFRHSTYMTFCNDREQARKWISDYVEEIVNASRGIFDHTKSVERVIYFVDAAGRPRVAFEKRNGLFYEKSIGLVRELPFQKIDHATYDRMREEIRAERKERKRRRKPISHVPSHR